jgi:malate dehydrogenase (oxaloacetate-decarboxylating)
MSMPTGASTSIVLRLEIDKEQVTFGQIATAISDAGGDIVAIDVIRAGKQTTVRDVTVNLFDPLYSNRIVNILGQLSGVKVINISDQTFLLHLGGKIEITPKMPIKNRELVAAVLRNWQPPPGVAQALQPSSAASSREISPCE